jgi:hypothetical protein
LFVRAGRRLLSKRRIDEREYHLPFGIGPESGARNNCGFPPMKANRRSAHAKEPVHGIADRPNPR